MTIDALVKKELKLNLELMGRHFFEVNIKSMIIKSILCPETPKTTPIEMLVCDKLLSFATIYVDLSQT